MKAARGVYWGRFNPPHNGHLKVVRHLLAKECHELIIAIGSSLASHTERNPFSGGERTVMMRDLLAEAGLLEKCIIVQVPDGESYMATAANLRVACPPFDAVYTNRPVIADIFCQWGVVVKGFPDFERGKYNSTTVRNALLRGGNVSSIVPPAVAEWLRKNGGIKRLETCLKDKYE